MAARRGVAIVERDRRMAPKARDAVLAAPDSPDQAGISVAPKDCLQAARDEAAALPATAPPATAG